jgi:SAM-dependent methyltransferase
MSENQEVTSEEVKGGMEQCCVVQCDLELGENYWNNQYESGKTGWDLGMASPALVRYIDSLQNKDVRVLIPGCGNAYEAQYLLDQGFTNITLIDIAPALVNQLQQKYAGNPNIIIVLGDFFEFEGQFDVIIEQTFFCAIQPYMRSEYVKQMRKLLSPSGELAGLLFDTRFDFDGPPFGGCKCEYTPIFDEGGLRVDEMEMTEFSAKPRAGTELFFRAGVKKASDVCVSDAACGIKQYASIAEKLDWNSTKKEK